VNIYRHFLVLAKLRGFSPRLTNPSAPPTAVGDYTLRPYSRPWPVELAQSITSIAAEVSQLTHHAAELGYKAVKIVGAKMRSLMSW
jgi:hypothetical protein